MLLNSSILITLTLGNETVFRIEKSVSLEIRNSAPAAT